jgi:hypothetical protein
MALKGWEEGANPVRIGPTQPNAGTRSLNW